MKMQFLQGTDQNERSKLIALAGGIILHGVLNFFVGEGEILGLAQLIPLNIVGVHEHNGNARFLGKLIAKLIGIFRIDQSHLLIYIKAGAEIEAVNAAYALAAHLVEHAADTERLGKSRADHGQQHPGQAADIDHQLKAHACPRRYG